jgi:hypothetical protein
MLPGHTATCSIMASTPHSTCNTGKELWQSLSSKESGYSPPTLIEAGGVRQLLIWHGAAKPATRRSGWLTGSQGG